MLPRRQMTSVAIYSDEDKSSAHRQKSDEAYLVGLGMDPVGACADHPFSGTPHPFEAIFLLSLAIFSAYSCTVVEDTIRHALSLTRG